MPLISGGIYRARRHSQFCRLVDCRCLFWRRILTLKKRSATLVVVLALALTASIVAATPATAAPATGEVLRMTSDRYGGPTESRLDINPSTAQASNPVTIPGLGSRDVTGSEFDSTL